MELFGLEIDSWIIASLLAVLMIAGWALGWQRGVRNAASGKINTVNVNDAILALFGLLLGFTFSMSLAKHDQRRLMLVNDSNCIGDFATCVSMLKEPQRGKILTEVRAYLQMLLKPFPNMTEKGVFAEKLDSLQSYQGKIQTLVGQAIEASPHMTVSILNTFNGLSSSHASRLASLRDRLPLEIIFLLSFAALITMMLQGQRQGEAGNRLFTPSLGFIVLVSMVIWVTLDLNQPNRGWIRLNKEPLERLLAGLGS
ncbi:MAG: hypothetical protein QM703_24495 [Gemmatales bacterium]